MEKGLISIIVPCYNSASYLDNFFKCLLNQTYKKTEIIFINDGSTDETINKLNSFASSNANVKVYSQRNRGVSAARNVGIMHANGEYLYIVDSDDSFADNTLFMLHCAIVNFNTDFSCCGIKKNLVFSDSNKIKNPRIFDNVDDIMAYHLGRVSVATWNKLLIHSIVQQIPGYPYVFDENSARGEDALFLAKYISLCKKAVFFKNKL